jgi:DNA/RNA endonuclease YhcR with UshA esterase domain
MLSISLFTVVAILAMASLAFGQTCQDLHDSVNGCGPSSYDTQTVTVTGVVYVENGVYNGGSVYIQCPGGSGGMTIFDYGLAGVVVNGDEISVTGVVDDYNGEIEIISDYGTDPGSVIVNSSGNPVVPTLIGTADLADGTNLFGDYMEVTGVLALVSSGFNSIYTVDDGSGPVTVYVDGTTGIDTAGHVDTFLGDIVTVRGSTKCYNGSGEILPRSDADVILTAVPTPSVSWGSMKAQY